MSYHTQARLAQIYRTPVRKVKTLSAVERKLWAHHVIAQAKRTRKPHAAVASPPAAGSLAKPKPKPAPARTSGRQARGKLQEARAHRRGSGRGGLSASQAAVDQTPVDQVLLSPTPSAVCVHARGVYAWACACVCVRACVRVH